MVLAHIQFHLFFPGSQSLKDKRQILKGLKDRLRANYNISLLEDEEHADVWQRALLQCAFLSHEMDSARETLASLRRTVETDVRLILTHTDEDFQ